ncbi:Stage V sporulation protein S [compost metagenome]
MLFKVSAKSRVNQLAGAIVWAMRQEGQAELQPIGASAVNQALKAVAVAGNLMKAQDVSLVCTPSFVKHHLDGGSVTGLTLRVGTVPLEAAL